VITGGYTSIMDLDEVKERAKSFSVNNILKHYAYQNKPLDFETAYIMGVFTLYPYKQELDGVFSENKELAEKQSIAALCSLHNKETYKKEGAEQQIAGICAAIFDYDIRTSENSYLNPKIEYALDNCGMGGDLLKTPNVSTIAGLIACAQGTKVCKHGSPGNTDSVGSSDFLKYCGVDLFTPKEKVEYALEKTGFGYTDALDTKYKNIHVQTHSSAHLAHMNDIIGPITNPLNPKLMKKRILGINHLIHPEVGAKAYKVLNERGVTSLERGIFVRGFADKERNGGMDEASILEGGTIVAELNKGEIRVYDMFAEDFGLKPALYEEISPGDNKVEKSKRILSGKDNTRAADLVCANAALIDYLVNGISLKDGMTKAKSTLRNGKAYKKIEEYIKATQR
jgi:anthranilate phosphoribosyltransferase